MHSMSGPFKLIALDAMQLFIKCDVLLGAELQPALAFEEIVDAITK